MTNQNLEVIQVFRKKVSDRHSIETLFKTLLPYFKSNKPKQIEVKRNGAMPWTVLSNLCSLGRLTNSLLHVTGDIHYMAILNPLSIITVHDIGSLLNNAGWKRPYYYLLWIYLPFKRTKIITVVSEFSKRELNEIAPWASHKIRIIHNAVDPNKFRFQPKEKRQSKPRILMVGTKQNKNIENMMQAVAEFDCIVTIIGSMNGAQKRLCDQLLIEYENKNNLTEKEVIAEYIKCDLLAFVSFYEGFGLPLIEAQAIGRPVVTSKKGSLYEVGKESVRYADPSNVEDIRSKINEILQDEELYHQLVMEGQDNAKRFLPEQIAGQYEEIYIELSDE